MLFGKQNDRNHLITFAKLQIPVNISSALERMASACQNTKIDFSDSICTSVLWASASATSSMSANLSSAGILQTQSKIISDRRTAMAGKIFAKFSVTGGENEGPVQIDDKFAVKKFIALDPIHFESYKHYSLSDHFNSSEDIKKISSLIRNTIQDDLIIAHANNITKRSEEFNDREVRELEELFSLRDSNIHENQCETAFLPDRYEGNRKIMVFDFDKLELDEGCLLPRPGCMGIDEKLHCHVSEALYNADNILQSQQDIIREFRESEVNSLNIADLDNETAETKACFAKFITLPNLDYGIQQITAWACFQSETMGACTSFMMQELEAKSLKAEFGEHPIFVCADYGTQNYLYLVETCKPRSISHDDDQELSLLAIEGFPQESHENIKARSLNISCSVLSNTNLTTTQYRVQNESIYL
jgi:hypothetical protein